MARFFAGPVRYIDDLYTRTTYTSLRQPTLHALDEKQLHRNVEEDSEECASPSSSSTAFDRYNSSHRQVGKRVLSLLFLTIAVLSLILIYSPSIPHNSTIANSSAPWRNPTVLFNPHHKGVKYAYAVLLSSDGFGEANEKEDPHYFTGTRMLIHQLLHDPHTRGNRTDIDFLLLVTQNVAKARRDRLEDEGAIVLDAPHLQFDWLQPGGFGRWSSVMDKLEVFRLTQYEKILLLDTDVVVLHPISDIFTSPQAEWRDNLNDPANTLADEGPQPPRYLMAANSDPGPTHRHHIFPPPKCADLNAGFVLLGPSLAAYEFYLSVARIPNRFDSFFPEQALWNYTHRREGNMPWSQLDVLYNVMEGNKHDLWAGTKSFHEKYWAEGGEDVRVQLNQAKGRMKGFWEGVGMPWTPS